VLTETGNLYTVAAPSGTGKTTLVKALVAALPNITVSISHTTRAKRPAEQHGVNYYFIEEPEFRQMIADGDFLEYATVFNNLYGTSKRWVEDTLARGQDVILEIDWQGCQQIKDLFPQSIGIFILPPSMEALAQRLVDRNQDKSEIIQQRLADVREAVSHIFDFNFVVVNDDFEKAVEDLKTIVKANRLSKTRQTAKHAKLIQELIRAQLD
jgi:guanylate kinase